MSARKERVVAHFTDGSGKVMDLTWFNGGKYAKQNYAIGKALELLRRNGLVKAESRFGCSELLEFTATGITDKGREFLAKGHL